MLLTLKVIGGIHTTSFEGTCPVYMSFCSDLPSRDSNVSPVTAETSLDTGLAALLWAGSLNFRSRSSFLTSHINHLHIGVYTLAPFWHVSLPSGWGKLNAEEPEVGIWVLLQLQYGGIYIMPVSSWLAGWPKAFEQVFKPSIAFIPCLRTTMLNFVLSLLLHNNNPYLTGCKETVIS